MTDPARTAVVTGGGTGIGRAIARLLAADGWGVAVLGRRRAPLEEVAAETGAVAVAADLARPDDVGPLCVYLAADESAWVTGTVVQVTGGSPLPVGYLTYLHHKNKDL